MMDDKEVEKQLGRHRAKVTSSADQLLAHLLQKSDGDSDKLLIEFFEKLLSKMEERDNEILKRIKSEED